MLSIHTFTLTLTTFSGSGFTGSCRCTSRTIAECYRKMSHPHVSQFFLSYPDFMLDQDAPPTREFLRLKRLNHWGNGDDAYIEARERFADALAEDFNAKYGTDIDNIHNWHTLCHVLGIDPVPKGISACRKVRASGEMNSSNISCFYFFFHIGRKVEAHQPGRSRLPSE